MKLQWYGNLKAGIIILILSIIPVSWAHEFIYLGFTSTGWERVEGKIEEVKAYTPSTGKGGDYRVSSRYTYAFNGVDYTSDKVTVDGPFKTPFKSTQKEKVKEFQEGHTVTVYVNPENPSSSVLIAGMTPNGYVPIMFTAFLFTCGALITFAWFKMKQSEPVR